jgi:hypothetical protein
MFNMTICSYTKYLIADQPNTRLTGPYVGLVNIFEPSDIRTMHAHIIRDNQDLNTKHVMPVLEEPVHLKMLLILI